MKTKVITILAALMFLPVPQVQAVLNIYSDAVIQEGDYYDTVVNVYDTPPDNTTVNMTGGFVHNFRSYDSSVINMTGGEILTLDAYNTSTANISGGNVHSVFTRDHATTNLYDGGIVFSLGAARQSGVVNMKGGITEYLRAGESGIINLYGGTVNIYLNAWDSATVNIYGYGFDYDPSAGNWNGGQLAGFWLDDTPFIIDLAGSGTYSHINLVPEPSSLILFALGALLIRRKK
jgi:hypothetical protein